MAIDVKTPALPFKEKEIFSGTIERWYEKMLQYAHENYERGWDRFVECYGKGDFASEVEEANLKCYGTVFSYFKEKFEILKEREEEARSLGGWTEQELRDDYIASLRDDEY